MLPDSPKSSPDLLMRFPSSLTMKNSSSDSSRVPDLDHNDQQGAMATRAGQPPLKPPTTQRTPISFPSCHKPISVTTNSVTTKPHQLEHRELNPPSTTPRTTLQPQANPSRTTTVESTPESPPQTNHECNNNQPTRIPCTELDRAQPHRVGDGAPTLRWPSFGDASDETAATHAATEMKGGGGRDEESGGAGGIRGNRGMVARGRGFRERV
ncbi:hypothetical protein Droror1_Dr00028222, partial [Drosera rotundifolia]